MKMSYKILLEIQQETEGLYLVTSPDLKGFTLEYETLEQAMKESQEMAELFIEFNLEKGWTHNIPEPLKVSKKTKEEKLSFSFYTHGTAVGV